MDQSQRLWRINLLHLLGNAIGFCLVPVTASYRLNKKAKMRELGE